MLTYANVLLGCMLVVYLTIIYRIADEGVRTCKTVSCVITKNYAVFFLMIIMGVFTILYEIERKSIRSLFVMIFILVGIYGLILSNTGSLYHSIFTVITFISIIIFMIFHARNYILYILLFIQVLIAFLCYYYVNKINIFYLETLFILNFAVFYLSLHYLTFRWNYFLNN